MTLSSRISRARSSTSTPDGRLRRRVEDDVEPEMLRLLDRVDALSDAVPGADAYPTRFEGSIATSSRSSRRDTGRPRRAPGDFFAVYSSTAATAAEGGDRGGGGGVERPCTASWTPGGMRRAAAHLCETLAGAFFAPALGGLLRRERRR